MEAFSYSTICTPYFIIKFHVARLTQRAAITLYSPSAVSLWDFWSWHILYSQFHLSQLKKRAANSSILMAGQMVISPEGNGVGFSYCTSFTLITRLFDRS